jgi:hypothetical protein
MKWRRIVEDYETRLAPTPDAGAAFARASGKSEHERFADGEIEFEVRIRDIDLPDGTSLEMRVNGFFVTSTAVARGKVDVRLSHHGGDTIPPCGAGSRVDVLLGPRTVMSGIFQPD